LSFVEDKNDIDGPTMPAELLDGRARPTTTIAPTFVNLPVEVKSHIASFLKTAEAKALVQTCKSWQDPTEVHLWQKISLDPLRLLDLDAIERSRQELSHAEWEPFYQTLRQRIIEKGRAIWGNLYRAITQKPIRLAYLKRFSFVAAIAFWPEISRVMPIIAPYVEQLRPESSLSYSDDFPDCGLDAVDVARSMPQLKKLDLKLTGTSRYSKLASALRSTPNLEELSLEMVADLTSYEEQPQEEVFPELPKLSRINFAFDTDLYSLIPVFGIKAPSLRCLYIYDLEGLDANPDISDDLRGFSNLETLAIISPIVLQWALPLLSQSGPLPKLQRLVASVEVSSTTLHLLSRD
jgi:hypothetical protein